MIFCWHLGQERRQRKEGKEIFVGVGVCSIRDKYLYFSSQSSIKGGV